MASTVLHLRISEKDLATLKKRADRQGVPVSTYARSLLLSSLQKTTSAHTAREVVEALEGEPKLLRRLRRVLLFSMDD
jgi:hypothetical protein